MNTLSWRKDLKLNDVEVKTLSWRKDLKLNAARCSSGTHATVRFTIKTFVTSGSQACLDLGDVKVENVIVTFNEEKDEYTLVEEGLQIERCMEFHRDAFHREIHHQRNIRDTRLPREACFDKGDVKVDETNRDHQ